MVSVVHIYGATVLQLAHLQLVAMAVDIATDYWVIAQLWSYSTFGFRALNSELLSTPIYGATVLQLAYLQLVAMAVDIATVYWVIARGVSGRLCTNELLHIWVQGEQFLF